MSEAQRYVIVIKQKNTTSFAQCSVTKSIRLSLMLATIVFDY
jgi:hypothetical protein